MALKKYQWSNNELRKKHSRYNNFALLMGLVAIALLYLLPESVKALSILFMVIGAVAMVLSWRLQGKDKAIKAKLLDK